jgi:uncharacterized repeat protein (TIGR03806 family)
MEPFRFLCRAVILITLLTNSACGSGDSAANKPQKTDLRPCSAFDLATASTVTLKDAFANLSFNGPVALLGHPSEADRWYVVEQGGTVRTFSGSDATRSTVFIDISDRVSSGGEAGLLGMAFHPDFDTNRIFHLSYTGPGSPLMSHISAFVANDSLSADPQSETMILNLAQPFLNHNGGGIAFGPDGFLYIGFGDGGSGGDPQENGQNPHTLLGALLRIDINQSDSARGLPYSIPAGNPFAGSRNCASAGGCPEVFAYGLRNPWRWSFDRDTGELWVGDVGQDAWEEVDRIMAGSNYGWNIMEGNHCYAGDGCDQQNLILPVTEYGHDEGNSITGGYVYRGSAMPDLIGDYIFGDFGSGRIFRIIDAAQGGAQVEELLLTGVNIASFGEDRSGELFVLSYGDGRIYRLAPQSSAVANIPKRLSETGYFQSSDPTQPVDCFIPYQVNAPFWSDGAQKERWLGLPSESVIDNADDTDWRFPAGSVLIKNFWLDNRPIETRLLVQHAEGQWAGYSYKWNEDGSDALLTTGKTVSINGQDWIYPSQSDCLKCHTSAAGRSLGLETAQLNATQSYPDSGETQNQLIYLDEKGLLSTHLGTPTDSLPILPDPFDASMDPTRRARAYLYTNCSQCHRPNGPTPVSMDLRYDTAFNAMDICNVPVSNTDLNIADARILAPGDQQRSLLLQRMQRRDRFAMPPLSSSIVDENGAELLRMWITNQTTCQ